MKKTYSEKLRDPRWQKKRLEVLNRDGFKCTLCGDDKTTLNVHHKSYKANPWETDIIELKTLCQDCHVALHDLEIDGIDTSEIKIGFKKNMFNPNVGTLGTKTLFLKNNLGFYTYSIEDDKLYFLSNISFDTIDSLYKLIKS